MFGKEMAGGKGGLISMTSSVMMMMFTLINYKREVLKNLSFTYET
jgi:hypothetical protein